MVEGFLKTSNLLHLFLQKLRIDGAKSKACLLTHQRADYTATQKKKMSKPTDQTIYTLCF